MSGVQLSASLVQGHKLGQHLKGKWQVCAFVMVILDISEARPSQ